MCELAFALVDKVKQMALPNAGGIIQSVEGANRTTKWRKIEFALSA